MRKVYIIIMFVMVTIIALLVNQNERAELRKVCAGKPVGTSVTVYGLPRMCSIGMSK